jgi:hypothetical protein
VADQSYPELALGDQGEWVAYLQGLLEYAGHWVGGRPFHPSREFDDETAASLRSFHVAHGIDSPGVADQVTWEALVDIGERPRAEPTQSPYGGQGRPGSGGGMDPTARHAMGGLGNLVLWGPSPFMVFSIIGLIGGLAERNERQEKEAAALEALRTAGDETRRWTLAHAAANVIQDVLVSGGTDGMRYTTSEVERLHSTATALVETLHNADWVAGHSEIGVVEGWLGNIPEDVWSVIDDRVRGLWSEMVDGVRSGTPSSNEGPDLVRGAIDVDSTEVYGLLFSQASHSEYYVKGR